ncbi:MAG: CPBP family intramembrane metalloprotease [Lachnospiraceae bacterium]|nr:CPBP family intramembrane metalloprotease [Lachnospiraceae bacterium]
MNNHTWKLRENIRYGSILFLGLLHVFFENKLTLILLLSWVFLILIMGNVRRLSYTNKLTYFLRMTLYFLPYILPPLLFLPLIIRLNITVLLYCFLAVAVFIFWLLINLKAIKISLSDGVIAISLQESKYVHFLRIYNSIGAAVCEEFFFRGFILSIDGIPIGILIGVSTFFFMLSHFLLPWGEGFTKKDCANQLVFGIISATLFILSGSILPSILMHLLFNCPSIITTIRSYERHYMKKDYFDKLLMEQSVYDELEI